MKVNLRAFLPSLIVCWLLSPSLFAQWTTYAPMPGTRWAHVCATAGGKLYVLAGSTAPTWEYDQAGNNWTVRASIPTLRSYPAVASWDGMIYVLGGSVGAAWSDLNERFDPATNTWTTLAPMPQVRTTTAAAAVDGRIYVMNGWNGAAMAQVDVYDIATNTWSTAASAPTPRSHAKTAVVNNRIYLVGGYNAGYVGTNEVYDPVSNTWTTLAPMPTARYIHAVGGAGSQVLVAGGYTGGASNSFQSYDVNSNTWTIEPAMPTARYRTDGTVLNGCFYVLGGYNGSNLSVNEGFCGLALPVSLDLRAVKVGAGVELGWLDPNSAAAKRYVVERSVPAGDFAAIGEVAPDGQGGEFSFYDHAPLIGRNLYRLRREDHNGHSEYTEAVEVEYAGAEEISMGWDARTSELVLRWDPASDPGKMRVIVSDLSGRRIAGMELNASMYPDRRATCAFAQASRGIYMVSVHTGDGLTTKLMYMGE